MTANLICERCGAALPTPGGTCPRCLMELGARPSGFAPPSRPAGPPPPTPEEIAGAFPQLEILEVLGRGGMGVVYKARQRDLDRVVALKILPEECASDPTFAERFEREARVLARLSHPNVVAVHDAGRTGERYWLLMEYVDGVNLRRLLETRETSPREALAIVSQVCEALQFAHDEGVVHRDIKPENILVDRRGKVKIADFGLAKLLGQEVGGVTLTRSDQAMGTLHYISLGVVFYELLTGDLPLGNFPLPSDQQGVDPRLDEVVLKSLEREPERRYQQADEVRSDVQQASAMQDREEAECAACPPSCSSGSRSRREDAPPRRPRKNRAMLWGCGCALLLLIPACLAVFSLIWLRTSQSAEQAMMVQERTRAEQEVRKAWEQRRQDLVADAQERGIELERAHHVRRDALEGGIVRVEIAPYPEERARLLADLRASLDLLNGGQGLTADDRGLIHWFEEYLPYGEVHTVIEIQRLEEGWSWVDSSGGPEGPDAAARTREAPELPVYLQRFVEEE